MAITAEEIPTETIANTVTEGSANPIPDFLIYNSRTLVIGKVKKHDENLIAQLKNQVENLVGKGGSERRILL